MNIIISPFSKRMRVEGKKHPKNYPFWKELIALLEEKGHLITQVGAEGEEELVVDTRFGLNSMDLYALTSQFDVFISVENFFPHFVHYNFKGKKPGIVLFGKSDPEIFGYPENKNLLKDKKYLRWDQFGPWEDTDFIEESFVSPEEVLACVESFGKVIEN